MTNTKELNNLLPKIGRNPDKEFQKTHPTHQKSPEFLRKRTKINKFLIILIIF
jgi:hypothetical protein